MSRTRVTTLPFLLLELSLFFFYLKKILCLLCNSNTLWNISMVLGRNVEHDQTTSRDKNDNSAFLTFGVISLCYI